MPETLTFEEATKPETLSFEEAMAAPKAAPIPSPLEFQGPPMPSPSPPPATMRTAGLRERVGLGPLGDILGVGRGVQRELQREAGGGVPTPKELVDVGFQFASVPPPIAKPIEKITDVPINLLPPTAAGAVQGVRDIALQVPWAAGVVGMGKRAGDLLFGGFLADFLLQVPQAYEQYKALRAQGRNQEAARLAVSQVGTGLLMGAGLKRHQEIRAGGRVDPERAKLANDILELDAAVPGTLDAAKGLIQRQAPESQRQAPSVPVAPVAPPQREETPVAPVAPAEPTAAAKAVAAAGQVPEAAAAVIPEARALPAQAAAEASARAAEISKPAWVINLEAVEKAGNLNEGQAKRLAKWRAEQPAAPAAEPTEVSDAVKTRIEQESRQPEHPGVAQRPPVSPDVAEVRKVEGRQAGGGGGAVGEPKKEGEVLLTRDWDLFSENLADDLESFADARGTGKRDYDMQDVADRFVDYAKQDKSGKPLDELVSDFAKSDEASAGQIRKLRQSVKSVLHQEYWKQKGEEAATIQKDIDESAIEYIQKYPDAAKASIVKQQGMDAYLRYKKIADERTKAAEKPAETEPEPPAPKGKEPWEIRGQSISSGDSVHWMSGGTWDGIVLDAKKKASGKHDVQVRASNGKTFWLNNAEEYGIEKGRSKFITAENKPSYPGWEKDYPELQPKEAPPAQPAVKSYEQPIIPLEKSRILNVQDLDTMIERSKSIKAPASLTSYLEDIRSVLDIEGRIADIETKYADLVSQAKRKDFQSGQFGFHENEDAVLKKMASETDKYFGLLKDIKAKHKGEDAIGLARNVDDLWHAIAGTEYFRPFENGPKWANELTSRIVKPIEIIGAEESKPPTQPATPAEGVGKGEEGVDYRVEKGGMGGISGWTGKPVPDVKIPLNLTRDTAERHPDFQSWSSRHSKPIAKSLAVIDSREPIESIEGTSKGGGLYPFMVKLRNGTFLGKAKSIHAYADKLLSEQPPPAAREGGGMPPGPGAQTMGEPAYSAAQQLIDQLKARPSQGVRESIGLGTRLADKWAEGKSALMRSIGRGQAITQSLKQTYRGVRKPTDVDQHVAALDWGLQRSAAQSKEIGKSIVARQKNKAEREAVALWIDAGGNEQAIADTLANLPRNMPSNVRRALEIASHLPPRLRDFVQEIKQYYGLREQDAVSHEIFEHGLADYYTHVWKRPENMPDSLRAAISNGRVSTYFKNARQRRIPTFLEGIQQGKVPILDPAGVVPNYNYSLDRAIASRQFIADLSEVRTADGEPIFKPAGVTKRVEAEDGTQTIFIDPNAYSRAGENYRAIDHPALRKWNWKTTTPEGTVVFGKDDLLVHRDYYDRLANFMDRGRLTPGKAASVLLRASAEVKGFKLGLLSPFHQFHVGTHALWHWTMPGFKAFPIDWESPATKFAVEKGHLKLAPNPHELTQFSEGMAAGGLAQKLNLGPIKLGEWSRIYSEWLFGEYIPGLKLKTFQNALDRNMKWYAKDIAAGKITTDEVASRVGDSVNNAYGELNHLFLGKNGRNPVTQRFLRLLFLAPDFGEARLRFTEKAFTRYGMEERLAFLTMVTTMYAAARIANWQTHGDPEMDLKNAFRVKVGDQWVTMRSVAGDLIHALTGFQHFAYMRLNPLTSRTMMDLATGRDFSGRKLTTEEKFIKRPVEQLLPIHLSSLTRDDQALWQSAVTAFGVQIMPDRPAQDVSRLVKSWMEKQHDPHIKEKLEQREKALFPPSPYVKLRVALRDQKYQTARDIYRELLRTGHKPEDIERALKPFHQTAAGYEDIKPMGGLTEPEWNKFLGDITPAQRKMVKAGIADRYRVWRGYERAIGSVAP